MSARRKRWNASLLGLVCLMALATAQANTLSVAPAGLRAQLLASAQEWSDKGQTDVARQKIAKLLAVEPDSPEGLAFLGDLALRENKLDEALKILDTMQTWQPKHPATRELEHAYQVYSQQREKLARMRLMARAGRSQDAATLARELFPDGAPQYGALGQEIARITGQRNNKKNMRNVPPPAPGLVAKAQLPSAKPGLAATAQAPARPAARASATNTAAGPARNAAPMAKTAPAKVAQAAISTAPDTAPAITAAPVDEAALALARADSLRAQADVELKAERLSPALRLLEDSLQLRPDDAWLRLDLARLYLRLQLPQQARSVADEGVARQPADTDMRYARALLLESLDADEAALADLRQIPADQRTDGMRSLEQRLSANQRTQALDTLLQAARQKRSSGEFSEAMALFQQARQNALLSTAPGALSDAPTLAKIDRDIEGIEARRQAWVEVGQIGLEKNSSEGLGSLRGWERPLVAWLPWGYNGTLFAHVDTVHLDAGSYPGGEPFAQPGTEQITSGVPQRADGTNVGVGYVGEDWRWDLGEIGLGFAARNWVGGLRHGGELGSLAYSLELARRPLTGTLLSYAGTQDPRSGAVWGGVVATSAGGRLASDFGPISASFSASVATLTGQNVADNSRLQWRMAADRDVYRSEHQVVNLGLALSGLYHEKDLSGYTWGHGGYYSPVRNLSLALPVEWSGRDGRFTWLLRASVSVSDSFSSATDYYPGNAAMQQRDNRVYGSGGSTGTGWSVSGAAEYQASPNLAIGTRLEHEESDYYTPYSLLFYARYMFDPVHQSLAQRPRPVQAYSQF